MNPDSFNVVVGPTALVVIYEPSGAWESFVVPDDDRTEEEEIGEMEEYS